MIYFLIEKNITLSATILFLIIYSLVYILKPKFLFNSDDSLREFGVGYKNKTILPLWLISIVLGIFCYFSVLVFIYFYHEK
jgi:hypothetical protein